MLLTVVLASLLPLLTFASLDSPPSKVDARVQSMSGSGTSGSSELAICRLYPELALCRLRDTLEESLVEVQFILEQANAALTAGEPEEGPVAGMQKRKSAFVRFGKRGESVDESVAGMPEKRKSAFVRFGRANPSAPEAEAAGDVEKRKSSYVRFG